MTDTTTREGLEKLFEWARQNNMPLNPAHERLAVHHKLSTAGVTFTMEFSQSAPPVDRYAELG